MQRKNKIVFVCIAVILLALGGLFLPDVMEKHAYDRLLDAVESGDVRAVKKELDRGTDPDVLPLSILYPNLEPMSALNVAAMDGKLEIVRLLLDRGASQGSDGWSPPLEAASANNQIKVMELLIARGASVSDDLLWSTAMDGKLEAMKLLLAHGANPNTSSQGKTLLACVKNNPLICDEKLQRAIASALRKAGAK